MTDKEHKPLRYHLRVRHNFKLFWFCFLLAVLVVLIHALYSQIAYA